MTDSHFDQLLKVAASQPEPQQLLFVFTSAELPADATEAQRERFLAGVGGTLAPLMCVDKAPSDLNGFSDLAAQAELAGPPWQIVFAAALEGQGGKPPTQAQIEMALQGMVDAIHVGGVGRYAAFDVNGDPIEFDGR